MLIPYRTSIISPCLTYLLSLSLCQPLTLFNPLSLQATIKIRYTRHSTQTKLPIKTNPPNLPNIKFWTPHKTQTNYNGYSLYSRRATSILREYCSEMELLICVITEQGSCRSSSLPLSKGNMAALLPRNW